MILLELRSVKFDCIGGILSTIPLSVIDKVNSEVSILNIGIAFYEYLIVQINQLLGLGFT